MITDYNYNYIFPECNQLQLQLHCNVIDYNYNYLWATIYMYAFLETQYQNLGVEPTLYTMYQSNR